MLQGFVVLTALGYIGLLFVVASYGDRQRARGAGGWMRPLIYPLSLAIYCTSWTFFGSVGLASRNGYDFLTIYIGPILLIGLGWPLLLRVVRLAKAQNITSIADFLAARYGKDPTVAATVALIAILGSIPYIALQLKAVSASLGTILAHVEASTGVYQPAFGDLALFVALAMFGFAILFGTRHIDATEHQAGLILAVAAESMVKLIAFLAVGVFVTFVMFSGPGDLFARAMQRADIAAVLTAEPETGSILAMTLISFAAVLMLPRQFHVAVVENNDETEIRRAAWMFPLYLVLINLFVLPIAVAGMLTFARGAVDSDMYVLALPLAAGSQALAFAAFIGGLSAGTAMVIVECVALAIMVSNDLVVPLVLRRRQSIAAGSGDLGAMLLTVRRVAIFFILCLAYLHYRSSGAAQLASIGLLSFAAIAQLAPAFFGGLVWRRGTARGAIAGMTVGILTWIYTLLLPSFAKSGLLDPSIVTNGPLGIAMLRPQALLGLHMDPLAHGVAWSLLLNLIAYVAFSLHRAPASIERLQTNLFFPPELAPIAPSFLQRRPSVTVGEISDTVGRYLGEERTRSALASFAAARGLGLDPAQEADFHLLRYAEHLLASAIGAASSRLVLSLLLRKRTMSTTAALKLLDDANTAIQYNREIMQSALDHVRQGIAVFDKDLRLICWNRHFGEILSLPPELVCIGVGLDRILQFNAEAGALGPGRAEELVRDRITRYVSGAEPLLERFLDRELVVEVRTNKMPDGGIVATLTDITPSVAAAEALERANETLERRVRERTEELTRLNAALARAKAEADDANISKTRFLAAASHDILQPLNAARLYVTSLVERQGARDEAGLVGNIDASLEAVEEILAALLDISRLDAGAMKPEVTTFRIDDLLRQLEVEFAPLARENGLALDFVPCSLAVRSDRRLLRRLLQNLVSNGVKYTPSGRVLVGCRRHGERLRIDVYDTGVGVPSSQRRAIFREFQRLEHAAKVARGLGLGLSIVERIARVLDHKVEVQSTVGRGSRFSVVVPQAPALPAGRPARAPAKVEGQLADMTVICIDNETKILDGMETLLGGWGCRVLAAADLRGAQAAIAEAKARPNGLLVDYHLADGNGIDAIVQLRWQFGADLPAILITADRSPRVREDARARDIQVLNKPVKPAALRALLAQWRVQRVAAE
jgi:Na+/proline symporter/signal transduction histidine kinase